ncbi:MAG TPA: rhomboid family intramembrane serine protease [Bryobacteraceae bacterium]|jgi:membrane associated rhomboid family serine protease|nr:rhomboid family intramembrane serine protease [Bryobacteraceae bacterium]
MFPIKVTQPSYSRPIVTVGLIAANILVFLHEQWLDPWARNQFVAHYSLRPAYFHAENLFTHMFLHAGWIHVLGNMLFLWVFGDNVEDILGHFKYLIFYLVCGMTAGLSQVLIDPYSRIPMVGASGAIAGVMGAYLVKFPRSEVKMLAWFILIFTFDVPAWAMLIYWFAMQLFGGYGSLGEASQGGTAFFAHIGGFIMGIALIYIMGTRERYWRRKDLSW